jgi:hypothetical protein
MASRSTGRGSRKTWIGNIVLRNVSVGWGVDENIGINGLVDGVRIEESLIAEGLKHGGHPKGLHSMNLLVGSPVKTLLILGNVFATSNQRSPRLTQGNIVEFLNNFVYGFGKKATHIDSNQNGRGPDRRDRNVYRRTADSGVVDLRQISKTFDSTTFAAHLADNADSARPSGLLAREADAQVAARRAAPLGRFSWQLTSADSSILASRPGRLPSRRQKPHRCAYPEGHPHGTARLIDSETGGLAGDRGRIGASGSAARP